MRIRLLSDLHFEFHSDDGASFIKSLDSNADVCALAGDIATYTILDSVLDKFCKKFPEIIYVTGNHEYYGSSREKVHSKLQRLQREHSNLHFLNRNIVNIHGQRFLGTTLWFPYTAEAIKYRNWISDFYQIQSFKDWVGEENKKNVSFLQQEMVEGDIVITHHLPAEQSIHKQYKGSPYNCFFLCDMKETILKKKPAFWFHGHGHKSANYNLGKTRVFCNPFGYLRYEENSEFKSDLNIEIQADEP